MYGPRQALSNPYTGVLAIFAARLLNGKQPILFEDGEQRRDFVSVHDVVRAFVLALDSDVSGAALNVGSGESVTIRSLAIRLGAALGRPELRPIVSQRHRAGDIRHCFADITRAHERLGYAPQVSLAQGLDELAHWLRDQPSTDRVREAYAELTARGLI